jgi:nitrogen-specific signal transduction histidine kinase/ActR/RegA family two-component response regulator
VQGIFRDVTEQEHLEHQLREAHKMEAIGTLAGGIAHDFNNILSSILGYTELALDDVEKETSLEDSLQEIYTAGKRARDLVKQILAFARRSEEERKPIRVDHIAKEALKLIRSAIPVTIEIRQQFESQSLIMGNASQMNQFFMNLFTNAAHAMEDTGGILEVSLKDVIIDLSFTKSDIELEPGNYVKIRVSDTGKGIPQDIMNSIFEPYFTTKAPGEGTGMGLAMVHGIIESYGGRITVESKIGEGTVFTIYLPITKKRYFYQTYKDEDLPHGTERVLLIDDELPIVRMQSRILEGLGYHTSVRTSSVETLELFRIKPNDFDLVITDMTMPNMTGDHLAVELMKIRPDIPIILCTGYSKMISEEKAEKIGIKAFVYKPIIKADLAKTVRKILDESKAKS